MGLKGQSHPSEKGGRDGGITAAARTPAPKIEDVNLLEMIEETPGFSVWRGEVEGARNTPKTVRVDVLTARLDDPVDRAFFAQHSERLSNIRHPGLARNLGSGLTQEQQPYYISDWIQAPTLQEFCDTQHVSLSNRCALFLRLCEAIQHAHLKGIIHGGLRSQDIAVVSSDNKPTPRVQRMGPASWLARKTEHLPAIDIIKYFPDLDGLSPEHLDPHKFLDVRVDVHALGVVLYEMICGVGIFSAQKPESGTEMSASQLFRQPPPKPSQQVGSPTEDWGQIAKRRGLSEGGLSARLAGDLDFIATRALSKDRRRRHASVADLARDVSLHERKVPLPDRPVTPFQRISLFRRRNPKLALLAGSITGSVMLVLASLVTLLFHEQSKNQQAEKTLDSARASRVDAEHRFEAEEMKAAGLMTELAELGQELQKARTDSRRTDGILSFLSDVLGESDGPGNRRLTLSELTTLASDQASIRFANDEVSRGITYSILGKAYLRCGESDRGIGLLRESLRLLKSTGDDPRSFIRDTRRVLADHLVDVACSSKDGKRNALLHEAEELRRLLTQENRPEKTVDHKSRVKELCDLADVLVLELRLQDAEGFLKEAYELVRVNNVSGAAGSPDPHEPMVLENLADVLLEIGKFEEAKGVLEELKQIAGKSSLLAVRVSESLGRIALARGNPRHAIEQWNLGLEKLNSCPDTGTTLPVRLYFNLVKLHQDRGEGSQATEALRKAIAWCNNRPALADPILLELDLLKARNSVSSEGGNPEQDLKDILERSLAQLAPHHPMVREVQRNLGINLLHRKRTEEAAIILKQSAESLTRGLGLENHRAQEAILDHARCLDELDNFDESLSQRRKVFQVRTKTLGPSDPLTLLCRISLGELLLKMGHLEEAEEHFTTGQVGLLDLFSYEHPALLSVRASRAMVLYRKGDLGRAENAFLNVVKDCDRILGSSHLQTIKHRHSLALVYKAQGNFVKAEAALRTLNLGSLDTGEMSYHPEILSARGTLASILREQGNVKHASRIYEKVLVLRKAHRGEEDPATYLTLNNLAACYFHLGRTEEAEMLLNESLEGLIAALPEDDWRIGFARVNLGTCLLEQKRFDAAQTSLLSGYKSLLAALGPNHDRTFTAIRALISLYESRGEMIESLRYRDLLAE